MLESPPNLERLESREPCIPENAGHPETQLGFVLGMKSQPEFLVSEGTSHHSERVLY
jgi:hypothetical protein